MLKVNNISKLSHLSFSTKKFLQFYNWKNCKPSNSIDLSKKLSDSKVGIISSAGLVIKNLQIPFDNNLKYGDSSFRIIPTNINPNILEEYHKSNTFDHSGIKKTFFSISNYTCFRVSRTGIYRFNQ